MDTYLTKSQQTELARCEDDIAAATKAAFYVVGARLKQIRDQKLWADYESWETYHEEVWGWKKTHVCRLIAAHETYEAIAHSPRGDSDITPLLEGPMPVEEKQIRPLTSKTIPMERKGEAWHQIVEENQGKLPTASFVQERAKWLISKVYKSDNGNAKQKKKNKPKYKESGQAKPKEPLKESYTLTEWKNLGDGERAAILENTVGKKTFNDQKNDNIEWAHWSWNPVTGCRHGCSYCYARDIAESMRTYPAGFEPTLWPSRLSAPVNMKRPKEKGIGPKNVFTCSMADLFGKWVPDEWIQAVLSSAEDASAWNFLFLTKFPAKLVEWAYSTNMWIGATVNRQHAVKTAEEVFVEVDAPVKWLSIEPMIEPLKFSRLDLFDWVVIGGASPSKYTPEFRPPDKWVARLHCEAMDAGCKVYFKPNVQPMVLSKDYPGGQTISTQSPDVFRKTIR